MESSASKVLVVDDSQSTRHLLEAILSQAGFRTVAAADGYEALQTLYREQPNLVILDLMMPRMDGLETLRRIRELSDVPVLILSAKGTEDDKVIGLQEGADDYLTKPFGKRELVARVNALLRRASGSDPARSLEDDLLRASGGDIVIDPKSRLVMVQGEAVKLTPREFDLLRVLARHAGTVLPHETLITQVWGYEYEGNVDNLKLYIWYLRRKIEPDPKKPRFILTERGIGYLLAK
jgi:two-component system KDP operon response regulator KdpE